MTEDGLVHGPLGPGCLHVCVDMQALFFPGAPWGMPWMERILPAVEAIVKSHARRTVFTRFIPARNVETAIGAWKRYYRKWEPLTLERITPEKLELAPALARFVPPARILDKQVYSPWVGTQLDALVAASGTQTLVITGGETDVCVLATVLGAIDRGFRVVVASDAICGSADDTHDAAIVLYASRFGEQVEIASIEKILEEWECPRLI